MKVHLFLFTAAVFFLAAPMLAGSFAGPGPGAQPGFSLCLTTDKAVYASGEPVRLTIMVTNHTPGDVVLSFKDPQRFDFRLEQAGKEVWRWSKGRMFAQVLGQEKLGPGASLTFSAACAEKLPPGRYQVTGMIANDPGPLPASLNIIIR